MAFLMIDKTIKYYTCVGDGVVPTVRAYIECIKIIRDSGEGVSVFPVTEDPILDVSRNGFFVYGVTDKALDVVESLKKSHSIMYAPVLS